MTTWKSQIRAAVAYDRKVERDAIKHRNEVERRTKERTKLNAIEQAKLEVEAFENQIEVLLSIHKDCAAPRDWLALSIALPPPCPIKDSRHELRARQTATVLPPREQGEWEE